MICFEEGLVGFRLGFYEGEEGLRALIRKLYLVFHCFFFFFLMKRFKTLCARVASQDSKEKTKHNGKLELNASLICDCDGQIELAEDRIGIRRIFY